ncbi:MAG: hypothetical protein Ta2A_11320 [Treponemataceae bacterium]|nr:MAG: hypothetical protein Ta2A_11320 [Treponemataceae bacterium]
MNQHYISQFLINRWHDRNHMLSAYLTKCKKIIHPTSESIFGSKSLAKLSNNESVENFLNSTKIETNFKEVTDKILANPARAKLNDAETVVLSKYATLLCSFENNFWYEDENKTNKENFELISDIANKTVPCHYQILINPKTPFILTRNSFKFSYGKINEHFLVFPISPDICIALGVKPFSRVVADIRHQANYTFNKDTSHNVECIVFRDVDESIVKSCFCNPFYKPCGYRSILRLGQEQELELKEQGQHGKSGEFFFLVPEDGLKKADIQFSNRH